MHAEHDEDDIAPPRPEAGIREGREVGRPRAGRGAREPLLLVEAYAVPHPCTAPDPRVRTTAAGPR